MSLDQQEVKVAWLDINWRNSKAGGVWSFRQAKKINI